MANQDTKLKNEIAEIQARIADMRFDFKAGGSVNLVEFKKAKKELARLMTRQRALELGLVVEETPAKAEKKTKKSSAAKASDDKEEKKETKPKKSAKK